MSTSFSSDPVIITSHPFSEEEEESYFGVEQDVEGAVPVFGGPLMEEIGREEEEGFERREWRRQNMMMLEEKERVEKEQREQIITEAEEYKHAFVEKRKLNVETNKVQNREKEKLFLTNNEKFHAEADKQYWKAISDLIPHEIVNIEKKRSSKKDQENKKPSISVIQGPKPGKPTDLSRMRNILVKLKHNLPVHMKENESVKESVASTSVAVSVA